MPHLFEAVAEAVLGRRDAQRAALVALEALPAACGAPACAWQGACLVGLQGALIVRAVSEALPMHRESLVGLQHFKLQHHTEDHPCS